MCQKGQKLDQRAGTAQGHKRKGHKSHQNCISWKRNAWKNIGIKTEVFKNSWTTRGHVFHISYNFVNTKRKKKRQDGEGGNTNKLHHAKINKERFKGQQPTISHKY